MHRHVGDGELIRSERIAGSDPPEESLIEYPSAFPIKVMGGNVPGFETAIVEVAQRFDPSFDASTVEVRPRLKRTALSPISSLAPIAFRTGLMSADPAWQADPVEAATLGSFAKISPPTRPRKLTLSVFGSR